MRLVQVWSRHRYCGRSGIYDPAGKALAVAGEFEGGTRVEGLLDFGACRSCVEPSRIKCFEDNARQNEAKRIRLVQF